MSVWGAGLTISKYKNGPASRGITTTHPPWVHTVKPRPTGPNMKLLSVGSNLLSHTLPSAVPSARRRLSFRVRKGTGRFPAAINHRHNQPDNTTKVLIRQPHKPAWCVKHCIVDANNTYFFFTRNTNQRLACCSSSAN